MNKDMNRLRVILAEKNIKHKWLAEKMGKNPSTISLWCNNERQPSLATLNEIATLLDVDIRTLITSSKE